MVFTHFLCFLFICFSCRHLLEEMCASSTPKSSHLSHATNQKHTDFNGSDVTTTSVWKNPMVISFTVVGILFALSIILGALNFYIWYVERRNRRQHTGLDRISSNYGGTNYETTTPKTKSTNLAFVFMGRGRSTQDNGQSNRGQTKLTRQSSMAK